MAETMIGMTGPKSGILHLEGVAYQPNASGVYTIPLRLESLARTMGLKNRTDSHAPTAADIPNGFMVIWKNTGDGTVKLYYNDGGTLKSVALT